MKLHCFHGFLGNKSQFDFLKSHFDVEAYDMYQLCSASKKQAYRDISISDEDVVIGYSFGARFALELLERFRPKLFFSLAGHAGLDSESLKQRLVIEETFINKLESLNKEEFLEYWNSLDLFKHDLTISSENYDKAVLINMFKEFGLSKQKNYTGTIKRESDKIVWLNGIKDKKYSEYCKKEIEPLGVECIYLSCGHRLLQNEPEILEIIKNKVALL